VKNSSLVRADEHAHCHPVQIVGALLARGVFADWLWESETATGAEVRAMEIKFIRETGANDPASGYSLRPIWRG
jgi:hypothetical protein